MSEAPKRWNTFEALVTIRFALWDHVDTAKHRAELLLSHKDGVKINSSVPTATLKLRAGKIYRITEER